MKRATPHDGTISTSTQRGTIAIPQRDECLRKLELFVVVGTIIIILVISDTENPNIVSGRLKVLDVIYISLCL